MGFLLDFLVWTAPLAILIWASVYGLRTGKVPLFWLAATLDRRTRPLLYWLTMSSVLIVTALATYLVGGMLLAALT